MAYYDFNGNITIDEQAARRDIQKIENVLPCLETAKNILERLTEEGSNTRGDTGSAIVEKSDEILKELKRQMQSLKETQNIIARTVKHYQKLDQEVKAAIQAANLSQR